MVSLAHCILQYSLCMDFYITHLAIDVAPGEAGAQYGPRKHTIFDNGRGCVRISVLVFLFI